MEAGSLDGDSVACSLEAGWGWQLGCWWQWKLGSAGSSDAGPPKFDDWMTRWLLGLNFIDFIEFN